MGTIPLDTQPHYLFGRHPGADVTLEHPSISRQHAVIQFSQDGLVFVFDLGSTHGCKVNKNQVWDGHVYV